MKVIFKEKQSLCATCNHGMVAVDKDGAEVRYCQWMGQFIKLVLVTCTEYMSYLEGGAPHMMNKSATGE